MRSIALRHSDGRQERTVTQPHHELAASGDDSLAQLDRLASLAEDVIARCRAAGASEVEVGANIDSGLAVNVRLGEVETVEHTRDRSFSVTVYFGKRKGSASTADLHAQSIAQTIEQACAIARHTEEDPCAGLADPALLATAFPEFDLWHPWALAADRAIALGVEIEDAGRAYDGITNSDGASVQSGRSLSVYATSAGFIGRERGTRHSLSCTLIAEDDNGMQRDYWYDSTRAAADLQDAASIGRKAAERTLARRDARQLDTRDCPVLFAPEVARGLIGHFVSAVSGGALYRRASFLVDHAGKAVFPEFVGIVERPHLQRGQGSAAFDAEGVATRDSDLVRDGVLQRYLLGSYSARKLGLASTGNAGGIHNLVVTGGNGDFAAMLQRLGSGLLVTEVMGQGVSTVTGDYSRGASGFWVENGAIAYPVEEITIASNLRDMYANIVAIGSDVDHRGSILTGSVLVERMTVAGT
jgi:PmbA protein